MVSAQTGPVGTASAVGSVDGLPCERVLIVVGLVDGATLERSVVGLVDGLRCERVVVGLVDGATLERLVVGLVDGLR